MKQYDLFIYQNGHPNRQVDIYAPIDKTYVFMYCHFEPHCTKI